MLIRLYIEDIQKTRGDVRAALYIVLLALWGYSIDRRSVLHCLRLTDALMLLWLILRTLKYEVVTDLTVIASQEVTVCQDDGLWLVRTQIRGQDNA